MFAFHEHLRLHFNFFLKQNSQYLLLYILESILLSYSLTNRNIVPNVDQQRSILVNSTNIYRENRVILCLYQLNFPLHLHSILGQT